MIPVRVWCRDDAAHHLHPPPTGQSILGDLDGIAFPPSTISVLLEVVGCCRLLMLMCAYNVDDSPNTRTHALKGVERDDG